MCSQHEHIDFTKYILDQSYIRKVKCMISNKIANRQNGLVDSVRALLLNYNANNRTVLQMLVKAFQPFYRFKSQKLYTTHVQLWP